MTNEVKNLIASIGNGAPYATDATYTREVFGTPLAQDNAEHYRKLSMRSVPKAFEACSFENIDELKKRVKREGAIERAESSITERGGLLYGHSGAGKTSLAVAVYRQFADLGACLFASAYELAKARAVSPLGRGEAPLIDRAIAARFLVIDDLGSEAAFHNSAITEVIYERHAAGRGTLVTTWLHSSELASKYGDGIARRIVDRLPCIGCDAWPEAAK